MALQKGAVPIIHPKCIEKKKKNLSVKIYYRERRKLIVLSIFPTLTKVIN